MRRLFQKLIGNALKFHRIGVAPLVKIETVADTGYKSGYITISIEDNGIDFAEEYAERIFHKQNS